MRLCSLLTLLFVAKIVILAFAGLDENAFFAKFLKKTKNMNPSERAAALEEDESIEEEHEALARDSEAKSRPEHETNKNMRNRFVSALFAQEGLGVDFCSFVVVDQILWELDGRKKSAIAHVRQPLFGFVVVCLFVV